MGLSTTKKTATNTMKNELPVHDLLNESFHEHRPSFRSLVAVFDGTKSSFRYEFKKPRIEELVKQKSIRQQFATSFSCSIGTGLNASLASLGLISEEEDEEDVVIREEEDEEEKAEEAEKDLAPEAEKQLVEILSELDFEPEEDMDEPEQSSPLPETTSAQDILVKSFDKPLPEEDESMVPTSMKKKKKRLPKFATEPFQDNYELGKELGSGAFAVVKDGIHKQTGKSYAIKIVEVATMDQADLDALQVEINVMARLKHPNIIRLYETYCEEQFYYMVTEKMMGGELLDRVVQKTFYNEKEARDTCQILFEAMKYCHGKKIAHRDLKPENLLLLSNDCDSNIKIADFGFAKRCPSTGLTTLCGTPNYVAPEILERRPYDTQCDLWSLGVIVYILLGGYSPFDERDQNILFDRIRAGDYVFHKDFWDPISEEAKDFIESLLEVDPRKRLTAAEALEHEWMTTSGDLLANKDLGANLTELKRFNAKRKFKAAVKTIIATQKLTSLFV